MSRVTVPGKPTSRRARGLQSKHLSCLISDAHLTSKDGAVMYITISIRKSSNEDSSDALIFCRAQVVGWPPVRTYRKNCLQQKKAEPEQAAGVYIKVSMDGVPYLRKIDLKVYSGYPELLEDLEGMFKFKAGEYSEREGYHGSEFVPTYEDKDGDWMLVGDVPWK
ncbi:hypothetical protein SAY86_025464 [Trapa natans]|uniref:Auxin-responsive protein n=1 Tax=Trapa natans TaxID=22666 RepID=A0AAN7M8C1_TRANT|nr:hypothetical protein SAY86_025464 [Trapa natans]